MTSSLLQELLRSGLGHGTVRRRQRHRWAKDKPERPCSSNEGQCPGKIHLPFPPYRPRGQDVPGCSAWSSGASAPTRVLSSWVCWTLFFLPSATKHRWPGSRQGGRRRSEERRRGGWLTPRHVPAGRHGGSSGPRKLPSYGRLGRWSPSPRGEAAFMPDGGGDRCKGMTPKSTTFQYDLQDPNYCRSCKSTSNPRSPFSQQARHLSGQFHTPCLRGNSCSSLDPDEQLWTPIIREPKSDVNLGL